MSEGEPGPGRGDGRRPDEAGSDYIHRRTNELNAWLRARAEEKNRGTSPARIEETHEPHDPVTAAEVLGIIEDQVYAGSVDAQRKRNEAERSVVAARQQMVTKGSNGARKELGIPVGPEGADLAKRRLALQQVKESRATAESSRPQSLGSELHHTDRDEEAIKLQNASGEESQEDPPEAHI